jgi:hypothetical protein
MVIQLGDEHLAAGAAHTMLVTGRPLPGVTQPPPPARPA